MQLGAVQVGLDQLFTALPYRLVVKLGAGIQPYITRTLEEMQIGQRFVVAGDRRNRLICAAHGSGCNRKRKRIDYADPWLRSVSRQLRARPFDRLADRD